MRTTSHSPFRTAISLHSMRRGCVFKHAFSSYTACVRELSRQLKDDLKAKPVIYAISKLTGVPAICLLDGKLLIEISDPCASWRYDADGWTNPKLPGDRGPQILLLVSLNAAFIQDDLWWGTHTQHTHTHTLPIFPIGLREHMLSRSLLQGCWEIYVATYAGVVVAEALIRLRNLVLDPPSNPSSLTCTPTFPHTPEAHLCVPEDVLAV